MEVFTVVNEPIDSNCYVLKFSNSRECIIVDPGSENSTKLKSFLKKRDLLPKHIILTHEHFDHIWGVNNLKEIFGCSVISSAKCSEKITNSKKNLSVFYNQIGFECQPADILLEELSYHLDYSGTRIDFFETPGHSEGSISFAIENCLFVGDLMIKDLKTVTKLPGGNKLQLEESINFLKSTLNEDHTEVFPGHGNRFILRDFVNED